MAIHLVTGETGTGKTNHIYDQMIQKSTKAMNQQNDHERFLLIVPEQSTLDVQHRVIEKHLSHCITNIEVLSFGRLAYRMTDELEIAGKTVIDDVGKNMVISRIINEQSEEYPFLYKHIHKRGYINELRNLMSEFGRYALTEKEIDQFLNQLDDALLWNKLDESKKLYSAYNSSINEHHFSGDTLMELLIKKVYDSDFLSEASIYIDGFYGFTPIQYALVECLMTKVKNLTISITIDPQLLNEGQLEQNDHYYESHETYKRIMTMIGRHPEVEVNHIKLAKDLDIETMNHLRKYMFRYPYQTLESDEDHIKIYRASTIEKELQFVRDQVLDLVMQKGFRYKDIAVLSGDIVKNERMLTSLFDQASIPYYIDKKKTVLNNDAVIHTLNIVKTLQSDFAYRYIFAYLKSDYALCDKATLDYMENYVLKYGIRGFKKWYEPWHLTPPNFYGEKDAPLAKQMLEEMNENKLASMLPFIAYREKKPKTVKEHVVALYEFLQEIDLEGMLNNKSIEFQEMGMLNAYREYNQVYRIIIDLLDQLYEISGDYEVNYEGFSLLLEAGFEQIEIGNVPARMDEVLLGDLTRTRLSDKKAIFIFDVVEGTVPKLKEGTSLLTDRERDLMEAQGLTLAPSAAKSLYRDQFYIYLKLFKASDFLYLSYASMNENGEASRAAHILHMIRKLLPSLETKSIDSIYENKICLNNEESVYSEMVKALMKNEDARVEPLMRWYEQQDTYKDRLSKALDGRAHSMPRDRLSEASIKKIYGTQLLNTVTRLEAFARCPFAHFSTYGLKAIEREKYEISPPQLGIVFHRVIERFVKRVNERGLNWEDLSGDIIAAWVDSLVDETISDETHMVFFDSYRNRYMVKRLKSILNQAMKVIAHQISRGNFEPVFAEWQFRGDDSEISALNIELDNHKSMRLTGTIDRVDMLDHGEMKYITVIDYKSSSKDIDISDVYNGLQLQLFVYLNAAVELTESKEKKQVKPAGIFYFKVDDPYVEGNEFMSPESIDTAKIKKLRLSGLVIEDEAVVRQIDKYFTSESTVVPVKLKKDGQFSAYSKMICEEDFEVVRDYVKRKTRSIGNEIISGIIEPSPFTKKNVKACDYCEFGNFCGFDEKIPGYEYRQLDDDSQDYIASMTQKKEG